MTLDHPLPVGTVLTTAGGSIVKTITDQSRDGAGLAVYETYTVNGERGTLGRQTRTDLDEIVERHGWSVRYRPDSGSEGGDGS